MEKAVIVKLHQSFEGAVCTDTETGGEYWLARNLQVLLGYSRWESFLDVITRAVQACETSGQSSEHHFRGILKKVGVGSGAQREIPDAVLTRYACYLIAQNGDSSKEQIAFAQTYFAVQTRRMELIEKRLAEVERLTARQKLTRSEKDLSGLINERLGDDASFARIRSKGDTVLFGGNTTKDMKEVLGVPAGRALADFLPTITIKAKDFANEITNLNVKKGDLRTEPSIASEHVNSNRAVRKALTDRGISPEALPAAEDVKKVRRRLDKVEPKQISQSAAKPKAPEDLLKGPETEEE